MASNLVTSCCRWLHGQGLHMELQPSFYTEGHHPLHSSHGSTSSCAHMACAANSPSFNKHAATYSRLGCRLLCRCARMQQAAIPNRQLVAIKRANTQSNVYFYHWAIVLIHAACLQNHSFAVSDLHVAHSCTLGRAPSRHGLPLYKLTSECQTCKFEFIAKRM